MVLERQAEHKILHSVLGEVSLYVYQGSSGQAIVLSYSHTDRRAHALVRIQSACTYGDVLLTSDCDCRDQLDDTFRHFLDRGSGTLIYLHHEGFGTRLVAKARAYERQEHDGVDAFDELATNEWNLETAIGILRDLDLPRIALLTNNMQKVETLRAAGLEVAREALRIRVTEGNVQHLRTKQAKRGHELNLSIGHDGGPRRRRCFVVGAAVMDHIFEMGDNPELGEARQATDYQRRPGGKGLNQAISLARLGADATLLTVRGHDDDGDAIAGVLAAEGVRACYTGLPGGGRTPQTAVFQPLSGGPATYVGWLGEQHRTLRQRPIDERASEINNSDALFITLEASEDAIRRSISHARPDALVILNASPRVQQPYTLSTAVLESASVLIGSPYELQALLPRQQVDDPGTPASAELVARTLADQCGITVVATQFRSVDRWALAVNPALGRSITVRSPQIRETDSFAASVGMTDVFCAAFALAALSIDDARTIPPVPGMWRAESSLFATHNNLLDVVVSAIGPAAWVARSSGGYDSFPRLGPALDEWCRRHPPVSAQPSGTTPRRGRKPKAAGRGS